MPKRRTPSETWYTNIRPIIWKRDGGRCVKCDVFISLRECHIDHIVSGINGSNKFSNLRTLCYKCHVLRLDSNHRGMIKSGLEKNLITANWREFVWEEI